MTGAAMVLQERQGVLFGLLSATGLGLAVAISRFAYEGGTNGVTVATCRALLMTVGLLIFCRLTRRGLGLPRGPWLNCLGLGALTALMFFGNVGAVEYIPVAVVALLFFTYPPMIAVINTVILREPLSVRAAVSVAVAFLGLLLMLGVSFTELDLRGVALALAAAVATAWNAVWLVRRVSRLDIFVVTFHMTVVAAVLLSALCIGRGLFVLPESPGGWLGLIGVVSLQGAAVPFYFLSLARIGALRSGVITNLQPVVSIFAAFLLFGEMLTPLQGLGGAMVLGGVLIMQLARNRNHPP
jgi:DME family drug/metabolite transporter